MRRYLMVSPAFPPMSPVGAKRALHFVRNTPKFGWEAAALCLPRAPQRDPALEHLVPDVPVLESLRRGPIAWVEDRLGRSRAKQHYRASAEPTGGSRGAALKRRVRRFLQFPLERDTLYVPAALPPSLAFMKEQRCELVYVNASPFSALVTGTILSSLAGVPLVVDLRDPWSIEPYYRAQRGGWQTAFVDRLEAWVFESASAVILNTQAARDAYRRAYAGRIPEGRFHFIRNHFDPDLYEPPSGPAPQAGPFRIVYYGHLRAAKNGAIFLAALAIMIERLGLGPEDVRFEMCGEVTDIERNAISELGLQDFVHTRGWVPFTKSRSALRDADLLLDPMGAGHTLQISGKLYDYLAVGRPILSISNNREVGGILEESGAGWRVPVDTQAVAERLCSAYAERGSWTPPDPVKLRPYQAEAAARSLCELFDAALPTQHG